MSNHKTLFQSRKDTKDAAMRQAAESGVSMNLFVATAVAARAEAGWSFTGRGSRATPARAKALLMRPGMPGVVRDDGRLDAD